MPACSVSFWLCVCVCVCVQVGVRRRMCVCVPESLGTGRPFPPDATHVWCMVLGWLLFWGRHTVFFWRGCIRRGCADSDKGHLGWPLCPGSNATQAHKAVSKSHILNRSGAEHLETTCSKPQNVWYWTCFWASAKSVFTAEAEDQINHPWVWIQLLLWKWHYHHSHTNYFVTLLPLSIPKHRLQFLSKGLQIY